MVEGSQTHEMSYSRYGPGAQCSEYEVHCSEQGSKEPLAAPYNPLPPLAAPFNPLPPSRGVTVLTTLTRRLAAAPHGRAP